jgi:hypothetical protein
VGSLADYAAKKQAPTPQKPKKDGPSILGQVKNLYGGIVRLPVDLGKEVVGRSTPVVLGKAVANLAQGDVEGVFTDNRSVMATEMARSAKRTFVDQPVVNLQARFDPGPRGQELRQQMAGESIILQTLSPYHAIQSSEGNIVNSVVEDVGNVSMLAAGAGAVLGRAGNAAGLASAQARLGEISRSTGMARQAQQAAMAYTRGEIRAATPTGVAGRLAPTRPVLAARAETVGTGLTRASQFGLTYLDPVEGPLRALSGRIDDAGLTRFDRARGAVGDFVRENTNNLGNRVADSVLPATETVQTRRALEQAFQREAVIAGSESVQPGVAGRRTAAIVAKDVGAPLSDVKLRDVGRRIVGKADINRTYEAVVRDFQDTPMDSTVPADVSTPHRVAVLEAYGANEANLAAYEKAAAEGWGDRWIEEFNRSQAGVPADRRWWGEDIKAWSNYRNRTGSYADADGQIRAGAVEAMADQMQKRADVRTSVELEGRGRLDDGTLDPTQTPDVRPTAWRDVVDEDGNVVRQEVEFGVTQEAIDVRRRNIADQMDSVRSDIAKEQKKAGRARRVANVQGAVADDLAQNVPPTQTDLLERGARTARAETKLRKAERKIAENAAPPRDALPEEPGAAPGSSKSEVAKRLKAERAEARRLATVMDAEQAKVQAQATIDKSKVTPEERAADAFYRGRKAKDGTVSASRARRVFNAEGRRNNIATSSEQRVHRLVRRLADLQRKYDFVEEELSKSAQDVAAGVGEAAVKTMSGRVRSLAGELGEARPITDKRTGVTRIHLTGEVGKVARELEKFYGPTGISANDAIAAALTRAQAKLLPGESLSARKTLSVVVDTLDQQNIPASAEQMVRLQHAADVADVLSHVDEVMQSGRVNGTWLNSPRLAADALEELPWLPDDVRTTLRNDVSKWERARTKALSESTPQVKAQPAFARRAGRWARQEMTNLIAIADQLNAEVPGSGDHIYRMAAEIPTNLDMMTEAKWNPVHQIGGKAPEIAPGANMRVKPRNLPSQSEQSTKLAPTSVEDVQLREAQVAIERTANVVWDKIVNEVAQQIEDTPGLSAYIEEWRAARNGEVPNEAQVIEIVKEYNEALGDSATKKNRLRVLEVDKVAERDFTRARIDLEAAKRRLANVERAEQSLQKGGTKVDIDYGVAQAQKALDEAQMAYDQAELAMRPRIVTEAVWDGLSQWRDEQVKGIPLILEPVARFNRWYKSYALALSPRWWVNNAIGNPVMAMMYGGLSPMDVVRQAKRVRDLARPFGGDVGAMLEAGILDGRIGDILYELGMDVPPEFMPGGKYADIGSRGVEVTEGGMTRNERIAQARRAQDGGELQAAKTELGKWLRENRVAQGKALASDFGYAVNSNLDGFWRTAVYLQKLEDTTFKHLTFDPETGYRTRRDTPGSVMDLTAEQVDMISATALNETLRWMGDFSKMRPWERRIMRHIIPFWSWIRHSNLAFAKLHIYHPRRVVWMAHMAQLFQDPSLTERERQILLGAIQIDDDTIFRVGSLISPVDDASEGLFSPVGFGPTMTKGISPAINLVLAASTGINTSRGAQATRPGGGGQTYFDPLIGEPRNLAGYLVNKALPQQFRAIRDVIQGPGARYDTGQKKETGVNQGTSYGRLGALARGAGIPVPEEVDLKKARG